MTKLRILDISDGDAYAPIKDMLIGSLVKEQSDGRRPFPQNNPLFRSGTFVLALDDYYRIKAEGAKFTGSRGQAFLNCFSGGESDRELHFLHVQVEEALTKEQEAYAEIDQLDDLSGGPVATPPQQRTTSRPKRKRRS